MSFSDDKLLFLLSADWFFNYWPAVGIGIEKEKKLRLQTGCRALVKEIPVPKGEGQLDIISLPQTD
jgi:hypothetical protein